MDRFYNEQNINRYRRLANQASTAAEKMRLLALLAREMSRFSELQKAQAAEPH
jgi:hypothetical protein